MSATRTPEYRQLSLDSSNLLMEWDGKWCLGRYEEATYAVLQAGQMRLRMGQLCFETGDFEWAVTDWLCAAACFVSATQPDEAEGVLQQVQVLETQGHIPPERRDLLAALRKREQEVEQLRKKMKHFDNWRQAEIESSSDTREHKLALLVQQVRELPGLHRLHEQIHDMAMALGRVDVAEEHGEWASGFARARLDVQEHLAWSEGLRLFEAGKMAAAKQHAEEFLDTYPNSAMIRILRAAILAHPRTVDGPDYAGAIDVLRPLADASQVNVNTRERVVALAFSALFHHQLSHEADVAMLLERLGQVEQTVHDEWVGEVVSRFRQALSPSLNGTGTAPPSQSVDLPSQVELFTLAMQGLGSQGVAA